MRNPFKFHSFDISLKMATINIINYIIILGFFPSSLIYFKLSSLSFWQVLYFIVGNHGLGTQMAIL